MRLPVATRSGILIALTAIISALFVVRDFKNPPIIYGDAAGYYAYLPAIFIYDNLLHYYELPPDKVTEPDIIWYMNSQKAGGLRTPKGYIVDQYTYGVALLEAPAFFAAHAWALATHGSANGFSPPYVIALRIINLIYAVLGLLLTFHILRRYFSHNISLITTLAIFLGSNLFWFSLRQAGMSHIPLFFLYALLIWASIWLYERPSLWRFMLIGLTTGMITLIRPTDILCLIIPLLYGVYNVATFKGRTAFLAEHWRELLLAAAVFVLPVIPQLFYWKAVSGSWLYYSYGQQGFDWTHPHLFRGLWGGSNGWLAFSPLMAFSVLGILCWRSLRPWMLCMVLLLPLYIYVIYAWYCFNYINGFGSRPMIHLYPLLALPFAAVLQWAAARRFLVKAGVAVVTLLLVGVNLSFTRLQAHGKLNSEDSNWPFNLGVLFRDRLQYTDLIVKDIAIPQPDEGDLHFVRTLAYESFDDSLDANSIRDTASGRKGYFLKMLQNEYPPKHLKVAWKSNEMGKGSWIRCSGRFMCPNNVGLYENHAMVVNATRDGQHPFWYGVRIENKIGLADSTCVHWKGDYPLSHDEHGRWGSVWFYIPLPVKDLKDGDILELDVWNPARYEIYVDDLKMELWQ